MDSNESKEQMGAKSSYVSCMKINGIPLLPPLMTQEYKQEMQYYKKLALAVERRISDLKVCLEDSTLYSNNHPSDTEECFDGTNISYDPQDRSSFSERQSSQTEQEDNSEAGRLDDFLDNNDFESMNSQVTIIDLSSNQNSQIQTTSTEVSYTKMDSGDNKDCNDKVLQLTNSLKESLNLNLITQSESVAISPDVDKLKTFESPLKSTPSKRDEEKKDTEKVIVKARFQRSPFVLTIPSKDPSMQELDNSSLRINTKKNKPYSSPIKTKKATYKKENVSSIVFSKKPISKSKDLSMYQPQKLQKKGSPVSRNKLAPAKNITGSLNNISTGLLSPPKLVRQNSYTLDSPSPLLLAHLEVQSITSGIDMSSISMSESSIIKIPPNISCNHNELPDVKSLKTSSDIPQNEISCNTPGKSAETKSPLNEKGFNVSNYMKKSSPKHFDPELIEDHWNEYNKLSKYKTSTAQSSPNAKKQHQTDPEHPLDNEFENKLVSNGIEMVSDIKPIQMKENMYFDVILKKFHEDHDRQMAALLRKQQEEQMLLRKTFENQQRLLIDQIQTTLVNNSDLLKKSPSQLDKSSKLDRQKSDSASGDSLESHSSVYPKESPRLTNDDSMEKYLTISADVLNASRSLLINKKTVNLSPTDIQCVNVVPTQDLNLSERNSCYHSKDSSLQTIYSKHDQSTNASFELIHNNHSNAVNKLYSRRQKGHTSLDIDKSYEFHDRGTEPLETTRTNNTLDDLNVTFSSDDCSYVNSYHNDDYSNTSQNSRDRSGRDSLAKARIKINEIQKNLSSRSLGKRTERPYSDNHFDFEGNQTVSLSSIDVVPNTHYGGNFANRNHLSLDLNDINKPSRTNPKNRQKFKTPLEIEKEKEAATKIVSFCKGYLTRRLMKTERVETIVQTIKDTLLCAVQMHADQKSIQGPDIDLHRRLLQQITAACYSLHDIFIESTPEERLRLIRQDRERKQAIMQRSFTMSSPFHRQISAATERVLRRKMDAMSRSHTGAFTSRSVRSSHYPANSMTRSHYEQSDHMRNKDSGGHRRTLSVTSESVSRKPWR